MESLSSPHEAKPPPPFPNGALKKPAAAAEADVEYRECLKNHAAALGGHAVDGCGEFMPSATSDLSVPASLTCAACGCHRNFHRRLLRPHHHGHDSHAVAAGAASGHDDDSAAEHDDGELHHVNQRRARSRSPPPYYSAPHMLLALSGSGGGGGPGPMAGDVARALAATGTPHGGEQMHRRRVRTKFSAEQKLRMHELSEKLGWRMPKRDDGTVAEFCRRIGVEKGVFKVWMHNNKQTSAGPSGSMHLSRRASDFAGHEDEGNVGGSPEKNGNEGTFAVAQGSSPPSP